MEATSDNVDYSFSNEDKLIIHNKQDLGAETPEKNEEKANLSSETIKAVSTNEEPIPGTSKENTSINIDEAITKVENILKNLKKQRDGSPEHRRIIRDISNKRSRKNKNTSRYDSSIDSSDSGEDRSPSPKRTRKDSFRRKYDTDSLAASDEGNRKYRESSESNSDRSCSEVSNELQKELFSVLQNSLNCKKNKHSKERSRKGESKNKSKYSKKGDSARKSSRRQSDRYENYSRNYQQGNGADFDERYLRYYAVMYAFSIVIDILRQDDIYSNF